MELIYATKAVEMQCTSKKAAKLKFGGDEKLAVSLLARINDLMQADTIKDIIVQPRFHFHNLEDKKRKKLDGYFGIDVKTRRDLWRIIIEPLDENKKPYDPCNIDQIAKSVRKVKIVEVSKHYE